MKPYHLIVIFILLFTKFPIFGQIDSSELVKARNYLDCRGEVYFQFCLNNRTLLDSISQKISIDFVKDSLVKAYANKEEFEHFLGFHIPFLVLTPPSLEYKPSMLKNGKSGFNWDVYPTYNQYINMMDTFASNHPDICKLVQFGTSVNGRKLLFVKISDNVNSKEAEPEFMYSSTIHGDEVVGYILMLRTIDNLLSNYKKNETITKLIDSIEIWINPLFNPDGTYASGNGTIAGATRFNANSKDLNRNFPDPVYGALPNGPRQPETQAMMDFMKQHNFVLAANLHEGASVINYPWDSWYSSQKTHADGDWYQSISKQYVDTARIYSGPNYFTDVTSSGITEGADWYQISGGRQDYNNFFLHGREVTIELSTVKSPAASTLPNFWNYNYRSLLKYMDQCLHGIRGIITDSITNLPLHAKITILNHDKDSSEIYSESANGNYHRMINPGNYSIKVNAPGYANKIISNVTPSNGIVWLDIKLNQNKSDADTNEFDDSFSLRINGNPIKNKADIVLNIPQAGEWILKLISLSGVNCRTISKKNMTMGEHIEPIDISTISPGFYILSLSNGILHKETKLIKY